MGDLVRGNALYTFTVAPTIVNGGDIQILTVNQRYDGGVPTVTGGAAPKRFLIEDGMNKYRAHGWYVGVDKFGAKNARPKG